MLLGGRIGDVGYVAERKDVQELLERRGALALPISGALEALEYSIVNQLTNVNISPDFVRFSYFFLNLPFLHL